MQTDRKADQTRYVPISWSDDYIKNFLLTPQLIAGNSLPNVDKIKIILWVTSPPPSLVSTYSIIMDLEIYRADYQWDIRHKVFLNDIFTGGRYQRILRMCVFKNAKVVSLWQIYEFHLFSRVLSLSLVKIRRIDDVIKDVMKPHYAN